MLIAITPVPSGCATTKSFNHDSAVATPASAKSAVSGSMENKKLR